MNSSDRAYKQMLEEKIKKLQAEITGLTKQTKGLYLPQDRVEEKIERNKIEIANLQERLKDFTEKTELGIVGSTVVDAFDKIVERHDSKREDVNARIQELQELKTRLTTRKAKRKIDKKIEQQKAILLRLKTKDNKISGIQRIVMYPKYRKEMKKQQLLSDQQARVNVSESNYNDLVEMQKLLKPEEKIIDGIKNTIYEWKKAHYLRKRDRAAEILNQMKKCDSPILMRGAAPIVITKRLKEKFTNKLQQDQMMIDVAYIPNQSQNMVATAAK